MINITKSQNDWYILTEHLIIRTSYCRYNVGFVWLGVHACYAVSETRLV